MKKNRKINKVSDGILGQLHYEFKDWEKAFQDWKELYPIYDKDMQMILCVEHSVSGYYIERKGSSKLETDRVYKTNKSVLALEQRIRAEIELAKKEFRSPKIIK